MDTELAGCWLKRLIISSLKNNKSPSPDGFVNEFYKTFKDVISPLLLKAYHHAFKFGIMAPSWNEATVVVIQKEGKDPTECQSYWPTLLLNGDLRILPTFNKPLTKLAPTLHIWIKLGLSMEGIMEISSIGC